LVSREQEALDLAACPATRPLGEKAGLSSEPGADREVSAAVKPLQQMVEHVCKHSWTMVQIEMQI